MDGVRVRRGRLATDAGLCILLGLATEWLDGYWLTPRGQELGAPVPDLLLDLLEKAGARVECSDACPLLDLAVFAPCALTFVEDEALAYFLSRLKYVLLLRLLLLACTTLPPPGGPAAYATLVQGSRYQVGCSGHTAFVALACVSLSTPSSRLAWLAYACLVSVGILAARCHYSLCVLVAWTLVLALCPADSWPTAGA